jgi:NNP family nitrate/nitrite transporter-like MFS transporter
MTDASARATAGIALPRPPIVLGTVSFAVCFCAWGLISAAAPSFRARFGLSATATALLVAVPVLLGSLARLPVGLLADRFGGRRVFGALMLGVALPAFAVPLATSYGELLGIAFFLGLAGASFPVGVGYVSRWCPPASQGTALGIYGMGNIGQSLAVFLGPLLAHDLGWPWVYRGMAALLVGWGLLFLLLARDAPRTGPARGLGEMVALLRREKLAWVLALFYALTFGGFVAFGIYLPTLLRDQFGFSPAAAGLRAAGFVALATLVRPLGGWLADRVGGGRVLSAVFAGLVPFALLLTWPELVPFSVGALGCASLLGLGNGAVFKLVPEYFPRDTGLVTGLVGAMGGLGGFFPPLLVGLSRDQLGTVAPAFVLLAASALGLYVVNRRVIVPHQARLQIEWPPELVRVADRLRAGTWATLLTGLLVAAIVVGSRRLQNFDAALVIYTFATIFAAWGVTYHYAVWLQRPPTRRYWERGLELVRQGGLFTGLIRVGRLAISHIFAQSFIARRSRSRFVMHQLLFWGCLLAAAITFPLVFGWIHFGSRPDDQLAYVTYVFGFPVASFRLHTVTAWLIFHGLDIAAVLVIGGVAVAVRRRLIDRGAQAVQSFALDFFPLLLLLAISVTGLALTVSTAWLRGNFYSFLSILHAITVIAALLFLPFGKFFHIFQRPAQLGVKLYHQVGERSEPALCSRCGEKFASQMHIDDLRQVLGELGFDYRLPGPAGHWQSVCPPCKRRSLAMAQLKLRARREDPGGASTAG